jgi:hypothetical protein
VGVCVSCGLSLQYQDGTPGTGTTNTQPKPQFKLVSDGSAVVPLSQLTIRYWYTIDAAPEPMVSLCDYTTLAAGCSAVTMSHVLVSPARPNADHYMEVGFTSSAGNTPLSEVRLRYHSADSQFVLNLANDYSREITGNSYVTWNHVTLYRNGALIWGVEP